MFDNEDAKKEAKVVLESSGVTSFDVLEYRWLVRHGHSCNNCQQVKLGPMLKEHIWVFVCILYEELLCTECIEIRLGRPITDEDLRCVPWNFSWKEKYRG